MKKVSNMYTDLSQIMNKENMHSCKICMVD